MSVSGKYLLTPFEGGVICGFVLSLALSYLFIVLSCKGTESLKNPQTFMLAVRCWVLDNGCLVVMKCYGG